MQMTHFTIDFRTCWRSLEKEGLIPEELKKEDICVESLKMKTDFTEEKRESEKLVQGYYVLGTTSAHLEVTCFDNY